MILKSIHWSKAQTLFNHLKNCHTLSSKKSVPWQIYFTTKLILRPFWRDLISPEKYWLCRARFLNYFIQFVLSTHLVRLGTRLGVFWFWILLGLGGGLGGGQLSSRRRWGARATLSLARFLIDQMENFFLNGMSGISQIKERLDDILSKYAVFLPQVENTYHFTLKKITAQK